jgi:hypothetical protein
MPHCDTCDGIFVANADWHHHVQSYQHQDNEDRGRTVGQKSHSGGGHSGDRQSHRPSGGGGVSDSRLCFKCGQAGHIGRNCPQGGGAPCYRCGQAGHMSRNCPAGSGQTQVKVEPGTKQPAALPTSVGYLLPAKKVTVSVLY